MLTIFSCPKPFKGHINIIQRNAIKSWTLLQPKPEIILLGDDDGTAELATELRVRHIPNVKRIEYGTPLVNDIFQKGQEFSSNDLICYVNSDIILMSDFVQMINKATHMLEGKEFLIIGRKINVEINKLLDFEDPSWESKLKNFVRANGKYVTYDTDFLLFSKGMFKDIPPFAIGRCFWTQWFIFNARRRGIPIVDATAVVLSVESKHDYSHAISTGGAKRLSGIEYVLNRKLFKGCRYFTTLDATHTLTPSGLKKSPFTNRILSLWVRFEYYVYFLLKRTLYPYSLPLIVFLRSVRRVCQGVYGIYKSIHLPSSGKS